MRRPSPWSISPDRILRWVPEFVRLGGRHVRTQVRLLGAAVLVGIVAGMGAIVFYLATKIVGHYALGELVGYRPEPHPAGEAPISWLVATTNSFRPWLLLVVPTVGGLVSGLLVFTFAPEAEGHGTDAVIAAYHQHEGYIRPRVPIVKILASAVTIGTGGSGGREGPIAQIGAGFGSFLAGALKLRPADRRILCAAGMGAGIAAIFRAPLAGALFASEVLYSSPEFEPEVIIPAGIACVVSYCTFGAAFGYKPLFSTPDLSFTNPLQLGAYLLLVICMVVLAMAYTRTFALTTAYFHRLRVPRALKPAIGAAASGLIGIVLYFGFGRREQVLSVLSFGYASLQGALRDQATASVGVLVALALGKIATTSLTIGSGGSGGVFGPSMFIGGCGGGTIGILFHRLSPTLVPDPASFVIVGMAGFFAAAAKTPFSTLVIVSEMTGGYHLLLPALWVCVLAFMLSDRQSLYGAQMESRSRSPAHRGTFMHALLDGATVSQFLKPDAKIPTLVLADSLSTVIDRLGDTRLGVLPVVDDDQRLLGVVNLEEVLIASQATDRPLVVAADVMRSDVTPLTPDDRLDTAQELFVQNDVLALPVVNNLEDRRVLGIVKRFDVASAYVRSVSGQKRDPGTRRGS
jgi:chloride channel protein, CIC family